MSGAFDGWAKVQHRVGKTRTETIDPNDVEKAIEAMRHRETDGGHIATMEALWKAFRELQGEKP